MSTQSNDKDVTPNIFLSKKFVSIANRGRNRPQKQTTNRASSFTIPLPSSGSLTNANENKIQLVNKPISDYKLPNNKGKQTSLMDGDDPTKYHSPLKDLYSKKSKQQEEDSSNAKIEGFGFLDKPEVFRDAKTAADSLMSSLEISHIIKTKEEETNDKKNLQFEGVDGLKATLLDHQIDGLQFLMDRESLQSTYRGGLLCDDMGLGKTIQIISLILKNRPRIKKQRVEYEKLERLNLKATLVVSPVSLITQWINEMKKFAPELKTLLFHGPKRTDDAEELLDYDVVVTSYETLRSENNKASSPMFEVKWHRVVLDEAHTIKNSESLTADAMFNLSGARRWCLTGTPVQNNIEELQSLFIFIRCSELSKAGSWNRYITNESKIIAFEKLHSELDKLMLRRTKQILKETSFKLPPKEIHKVEVEFSPEEKILYQQVSSSIIHSMKDELNGSLEDSSVQKNSKGNNGLISHVSIDKITANHKERGSFYLRALVNLLRLRQLCCHWKLLSDLDKEEMDEELNQTVVVSYSKKSGSSDSDLDDPIGNLSAFMNELSVKDLKCQVCFLEKSIPGSKKCKTCKGESASDNHQNLSNHESAKVLKLIEILKLDKTRKTIVFSQFRQLLLLLGPPLEAHGIKFVMYDGSMNLKQKDQALSMLRDDPSTTVLLCSLKSGAVGLNLTAASQVVIFDPWWNPQVQEQAIDRVYRIGQTKKVDVYELIIKNSVEENIVKLQNHKRLLAKAITDKDIAARNQLNQLSESEVLGIIGMRTKRK